MMDIENEIKAYALDLGFCKCGIAPMQQFDRVLPEAMLRGGYERFLGKFDLGVRPQTMYPEGKSIIVLAYAYAQCDFPKSLLPMIGRAYLSRAYLPQPGSMIYQKLRQFETFLEQNNLEYVPDSNTLLMRPAAEQAGVASFGQNNFAYVDEVGSFVILYGYIVNRELKYDVPSAGTKCPPGCRLCVKACPTKALYAPFKLDPTKCIGFNNWTRDEVVPKYIRNQLGCHVHGCDLCQESCPRNRAMLKKDFPKDPVLEHIAEKFSLVNLLHMPSGFFEECVYPIMYNYLPDKKYFQRNAAIAIGNTKDKKYIPELVKELSNPHEIVRIYVIWALGEMDDEEALDILREYEKTETSEAVKAEIADVLNDQCFKKEGSLENI